MYNVSIPEISREELLARYERIKPIVEVEGEKYFLREYTPDELTGISYIWDKHKDIREAANMDELRPLTEYDFECIHTYGDPGMFKPSIAEVLAQIPKLLLDNVCAFEIIDWPKSVSDFNKNKIVFDNRFHISTVRLYE